MSYSSPVLTKSDDVEDRVHDFDLFDPGYVRDPYTVWSGVRGCPVLPSERWGGSHLIIGYEAIMRRRPTPVLSRQRWAPRLRRPSTTTAIRTARAPSSTLIRPITPPCDG